MSSAAIDPMAKIREAVALYRAGQLSEAQALCESMMPQPIEAVHLLGTIAYETGNYAKALEHIAKVIAAYPNNADFETNRGHVLQELGQLDAALASYDRALALRPDAADAYYNRGNALQKLSRHDDAVASYDRAIALNPSFSKAHYYRANSLAILKRPGDALAGYDSAIALQPNFAEAHFHRGNALVKLGRLDEALASFAKVMQLDPDHMQVRRTLLQHPMADFIKPSLVEQLGRELAERHLKRDLADLHAGKAMSDFRARHDLEQTNYLLAHGQECEGLREANGRLRDAIARNQSGKIPLSEKEIADIARFRKRLLRHEVPAAIDSCLNPDVDWRAVEAQYLSSNPEIIYIDSFLSPQALTELRKFCLTSTVWNTEYVNQYLGAFAENGFVSPLHLQLARELRAKMPGVFGDHTLEQLWAFKYDPQVNTGINVHADFAKVNLNFWITPDDANLDPASGGLVVYDVPAPASWGFAEYNTDQKSIYAFLEESGAGKRTIPYKCNRAVLFNSSLFHETDRMHFKDGYENRRINVTYLFGMGLR